MPPRIGSLLDHDKRDSNLFAEPARSLFALVDPEISDGYTPSSSHAASSSPVRPLWNDTRRSVGKLALLQLLDFSDPPGLRRPDRKVLVESIGDLDFLRILISSARAVISASS